MTVPGESLICCLSPVCFLQGNKSHKLTGVREKKKHTNKDSARQAGREIKQPLKTTQNCDCLYKDTRWDRNPKRTDDYRQINQSEEDKKSETEQKMELAVKEKCNI